MEAPSVISCLPPWARREDFEAVEVTTRAPRDRELRFRCERPKADRWGAVCAELRRAGRALKKLPVAQIVEAIDKVAARFCDPSWPARRAARDRCASVTGFSPAAVDRSFDLELRNYRADSLWRTLRSELGDPAFLDGPRADRELSGARMAIGPDLVAVILTGNVPGLPALSIVRSLLVKAPVIAKVASGEPTFAAAFADALRSELPALGDALLITYWAREERDVLRQIGREADVVIAYGGSSALGAVREVLPPEARLIEHGHKLSFGYVSAAYVEQRGIDELARAVAIDVATFNQHACIAPQALFVEGALENARRIGDALGSALEGEARDRPVGELPVKDAGRVRLARAQQAWSAVADADRRFDIWHDRGLEWTVTLDEQLATPSGLGHRFLRLIPVADFDRMLDQLRPMRAYLQNVGLGCTTEELPAAAAALAELGASRICEPGRMPEPSMMWRHDGRARVGELVRWCDIEMHKNLNGG